MAPLTFDALVRRLRQGPPDPVYYLYGDEDLLKDEAVRALLDAGLEPAARAFNLDQRAASDLTPESLYALLNTPPMLAARRAVVVRGIEQLRKPSRVRDELLRYLASPSPATLLVMVHASGTAPETDLLGATTAVEFGRLAPERVARWVAHRAATEGLSLEPDAANLLVTATGGELSAIAPEIDKLAAAVGSRPATRADVAALVGVRHGETLFDLVDAALGRRPAAAARLVESVLGQPGMSGVRAVTALGTALIGTALARAELDGGLPRARLVDTVFRHILAARPFGLRNWKEEAGRWAGWAEHWHAQELQDAVRMTLAADVALKRSTVTDDRGIVEQLVLSYAAVQREAA